MVSEDQSSPSHLSPFDTIRHVDEQLGEYWSALLLSRYAAYLVVMNKDCTHLQKIRFMHEKICKRMNTSLIG